MSKILIVEDDSLISKMYREIFEFNQYEVDTAVDGEEGMVKVKGGKPTLVLLDIMMPKLNGLEMLERMKADPETKNIPVVMLTNLAKENDAKTALAKGAVKYIVKSEYDPKQVADMVKEILEGYSQRSEAAAAKS